MSEPEITAEDTKKLSGEPGFPSVGDAPVEGIDTAGLAASPIAMVLTDPNLHDNPIVYVNTAFTELTGYSRKASVGRNCRFLQGEETDRTNVIELANAIEERRSAAVEIVNYTATGEAFINSLVISPIMDDNDEILFFLGVQGGRLDSDGFDDGRTQLEERLSELQHRVKNHLSMILSMIRQEARKARAEPDDKAGRASAGDTIELLATRVESIAVLYDYISHAPASHGDRVPLGAYVGRVCAATRELSERISVRMNIDTDPVMADAEQAARIGLILSEILNNAFQHAFGPNERGEVRVELKRRDGGGVRMVVADNGRGMSGSEWPNTDGSLGGRIVTSLVKRIDGELDVQSPDEKSGKGTTITLSVSGAGLDAE